jgi:hypothetical protein
MLLGGAPEAEVLPVRVSDRVVLLRTSALAAGLQYAADSGCDVITLSMGGLPSRLWGEVVDKLYERGVCICAAAGNHFGSTPPRVLVYPARFPRVIAVCGVMADQRPYADLDGLVLEGSFGPDSVMGQAIAAYIPNIPWPQFGCQARVRLDGEGTSAATPQVAAAAALWFENHKQRLSSGGSGVSIHPYLLHRRCDEASKSAKHVLTMIIRALDYLPPVDVTFFEFLRAIITADLDLVPDDRLNYRVALIDAFRRRGIYPKDGSNQTSAAGRTLSVETLRWRSPDPTRRPKNWDAIEASYMEIARSLKPYADQHLYLKERGKRFSRKIVRQQRLKEQFQDAFKEVPDFAREENPSASTEPATWVPRPCGSDELFARPSATTSITRPAKFRHPDRYPASGPRDLVRYAVAAEQWPSTTQRRAVEIERRAIRAGVAVVDDVTALRATPNPTTRPPRHTALAQTGQSRRCCGREIIGRAAKGAASPPGRVPARSRGRPSDPRSARPRQQGGWRCGVPRWCPSALRHCVAVINITSSSYSFQPKIDSSISTSLVGSEPSTAAVAGAPTLAHFRLAPSSPAPVRSIALARHSARSNFGCSDATSSGGYVMRILRLRRGPLPFASRTAHGIAAVVAACRLRGGILPAAGARPVPRLRRMCSPVRRSRAARVPVPSLRVRRRRNGTDVHVGADTGTGVEVDAGM